LLSWLKYNTLWFCSEYESEVEGLAPTKGKERVVQCRKASNREEKSREKLFHKSVALDSRYDLDNFYLIIPFSFAVNMNQKSNGWLLPRERSDLCSILVIVKRSLERSCFIRVLLWIAGMTSIIFILVKI